MSMQSGSPQLLLFVDNIRSGSRYTAAADASLAVNVVCKLQRMYRYFFSCDHSFVKICINVVTTLNVNCMFYAVWPEVRVIMAEPRIWQDIVYNTSLEIEITNQVVDLSIICSTMPI